jgi:hypothetical protein
MPALRALLVGVNCRQPGDRNPVRATPMRPTAGFGSGSVARATGRMARHQCKLG